MDWRTSAFSDNSMHITSTANDCSRLHVSDTKCHHLYRFAVKRPHIKLHTAGYSTLVSHADRTYTGVTLRCQHAARLPHPSNNNRCRRLRYTRTLGSILGPMHSHGACQINESERVDGRRLKSMRDMCVCVCLSVGLKCHQIHLHTQLWYTIVYRTWASQHDTASK